MSSSIPLSLELTFSTAIPMTCLDRENPWTSAWRNSRTRPTGTSAAPDSAIPIPQKVTSRTRRPHGLDDDPPLVFVVDHRIDRESGENDLDDVQEPDRIQDCGQRQQHEHHHCDKQGWRQ
jgi:hypothetical protein